MKVRRDDEHFGRLYTGLINIFYFPINVLLQLTRQEDKLTGYSRRERAKQTHKSRQKEKGKINGKELRYTSGTKKEKKIIRMFLTKCNLSLRGFGTLYSSAPAATWRRPTCIWLLYYSWSLLGWFGHCFPVS